MSVTLSVKKCHYTLEMEICVCVCVCAKCQMGVYDSTAGGSLPGDISSQTHTQTLQYRNKGFLRPQQCYSHNQPQHLHCSSSGGSGSSISRSRRRRRRTSELHYLYSLLTLYNAVWEEWQPAARQMISLCLPTLSHSHLSLGGSFLFQNKNWLLEYRQWLLFAWIWDWKWKWCLNKWGFS